MFLCIPAIRAPPFLPPLSATAAWVRAGNVSVQWHLWLSDELKCADPFVRSPRGMTDNICCQRCHSVGLVHFERVIKGESAVQTFRCDVCHHRWEVVEDEEGKEETPPSRSLPR